MLSKDFYFEEIRMVCYAKYMQTLELQLENPPVIQNELSRELIVKWVRQWGGSSSDAVLDTETEIFTLPDSEGLIGYRSFKNTAIVYGDPVCPIDARYQLVDAFHRYCSSLQKAVIYVAATPSFKEVSFSQYCTIAIEYGQDVSIDPFDDPRKKTGVNASLVRRKVRHAEHEGVTIKEYLLTSKDRSLEKQLISVGEEWLKQRKGPQLYISHLHLFEDIFGKRWIYATKENQIVGCFVMNRMEEKQGWHCNHLMVTPDAPHGTPEALVVHTLELLVQEECRYASFGAITTPHLGEIQGLNSLSTFFARQAFNLAAQLFHLAGTGKFWEKYGPNYQPSYLLFDNHSFKPNHLYCLLRALNLSL